MILIVGGAHSGKTTLLDSLAQSRGADAKGLSVVDDAELLFADAAEAEAPAIADDLACRFVVACRLVGGGIVPCSPEKRRERERIGRGVALLTARADTVIETVCGIPVVLKGPPCA